MRTITVLGTLRDRFKEKIQNLSRPYLVPGRGGFSLIEIIVVVALIAVVLGVIIIRSAGVSEQSKIDTAQGDLRVIEKAIHTYYLNHESYPEGEDWQAADLWNENPRILPEVLKDPFMNPATEYVYFLSPNGLYYVVSSAGPDGKQGVKGIQDSGQLVGQKIGDDIFVTNGTGT